MKSVTSFYGKVRYSSLALGAIQWKMGGLSFKEDDNGCKLDLFYSVNPDRSVLSLKLTPTSVKKVIFKDTFLIDLRRAEGDYVTVRLIPQEKNGVQKIEKLMYSILKAMTNASGSKSEVGKTGNSTPNGFCMSSLVSYDVGPDNGNKENTSPQRFTSVKSSHQGSASKRIPNILTSTPAHSSVNSQFNSDKKEPTLTLPSMSFYSQSSPTTHKYDKPPSSKRPRLCSDKKRLSDAIPYSMKAKPQVAIVNKPDEQHKQPLMGFSNMGNTCYINAVLQAVLCIDTLSNDLISNRKLLRNVTSSSLYYCLVKLLHVKRQPLQTADTARTEWLHKIKSAIAASAKRFSGNEQHDAHEFLCQLLDQVKDEVAKLSHSTPSPVKESNNNSTIKNHNNTFNNPVTVNFEFEVLHTLTCKHCQDKLTKTEQLLDIPLQFPKRKDAVTPRSLQDALTMFFKDENVDHVCEKCGHQQKSVSHKITRLPRVFILQLKRYIYNQAEQRNTKMASSVRVPLYLTVQNHCLEETVPAAPPSFTSCNDSDSVTPVSEEAGDEVTSRRRLDYSITDLTKDEEEDEEAISSTDHQYASDKLFTSTKNKVDDAKETVETDKDMETALRRSHEQLERESKAGQKEAFRGGKTEEIKDGQAVITLEDEDNEQLSKAIELSLREEEERNKFVQDYGGDDEMARVMELSILSYHESEAQRLANQSTEDKENATPLGDRPRLSDPSEFEMDTSDTAMDEVDGCIEEMSDLPEIHNETGDMPYSYRLVSVVKHEGLSSVTGHYTSDVYNLKKKAWYKCNDKHVMKISESDMKRHGEKDGYIFFYMSKEVFEDLSINHDLNTTSKS